MLFAQLSSIRRHWSQKKRVMRFWAEQFHGGAHRGALLRTLRSYFPPFISSLLPLTVQLKDQKASQTKARQRCELRGSWETRSACTAGTVAPTRAHLRPRTLGTIALADRRKSAEITLFVMRKLQNNSPAPSSTPSSPSQRTLPSTPAPSAQITPHHPSTSPPPRDSICTPPSTPGPTRRTAGREAPSAA